MLFLHEIYLHSTQRIVNICVQTCNLNVPLCFYYYLQIRTDLLGKKATTLHETDYGEQRLINEIEAWKVKLSAWVATYDVETPLLSMHGDELNPKFVDISLIARDNLHAYLRAGIHNKCSLETLSPVKKELKELIAQKTKNQLTKYINELLEEANCDKWR